MFIRSERLFLRPGWPEDRAEIYAAMADEAVQRNVARAPWPCTPQAVPELAELRQDRRLPRLIVTLPTGEGSKVIGYVGLHPHGGETELGYWIARDHWNRGYATEATRAVLMLARSLGHSRIVAGHFADNPASGRVLRKAGFCPTGRVVPRFCLARGVEVPATVHAVVLGQRSDCDGSDITADMRAA